MTFSNKLYAVHGINQFLWSKLQTLEIMKPANYVSGIGANRITWVPIIPTQQIEEFTEGTDVDGNKAPFIVYNWKVDAIGQSWFTQSEQIVYLIYSENEDHIREVTKSMINLFKRWDDSANEVNDWIRAQTGPRWNNYKKFDYKSISAQSADGPLPVEEAGARLQALVTIRTTYTEEIH